MISFFVFTPGFAVQYLAWIVAPAVFLSIWLALYVNLVSGIYLFEVYTYWSGGFPWYYANSWAAKPCMTPYIKILGIIIWLGILIFWMLKVRGVFIFWLDRKMRRRANI